ncbi:MAG: CocE/NonD family hydrolase [Gammaproteobacteria bacterium]|nr:CocE/NonD family hydrolase [Gammaproteobacteria bacterium]
MTEADTQAGHYDVVIEYDVQVTTRDGIRLSQDVYRPARGTRPLAGRLPVLLERTPYDKRGTRESERSAADPHPWTRVQLATWFASHGYVVVIQDCRGRFASEGRFTKYLNEAEDGFDTIEWINRQDWCGGAIGMFGLSYSAHTQTSLAALRPPGLKAMVLDCGGLANGFRNGVRHGGAFEMKQVTWAFRHARQSALSAGDDAAAAAIEKENLVDWLHAWPWKRGLSPLRWIPEYEAYLFDQWERDLFDDYWRQPALYAAGYYPAFEGIAVMLLSGWYDPYAQSTADNYLGLTQREHGATEMILGPWMHGQRSSTTAGNVDFGPAAMLDGNVADDYFTLRLDWFDHWLKGNGRATSPAPVRYFRMGGGSGRRTPEGRLDHGGSWFEATQWPPVEVRERRFFLHANGRLDDEAPSSDEGVAGFVHDPSDPVPTIGGAITSGLPIMVGGAFDQNTHSDLFAAKPPWLPLAARRDVLVFQTEELEEDVEITGTIWVRLWISSDAKDVDFTVKLVDVYPPSPDYPNGYAMNLTDGILRCRHRKGWTEAHFLAPEDIVEIAIEPPPVSNLFRAGHRIRIDIAGSNFPRFDVNPATGEPPGKSQRWHRAIQNVHCTAVHPSHIVLPVLERKT